MSDLATLQDRAARVVGIYRDTFGVADDPAFLIGKLSEEMGEVTAAHLKLHGLSRGADAPSDALRADLEDELADLFGFLLAYCDRHGVDLAQAFERKWGRYLEDGNDTRGD